MMLDVRLWQIFVAEVAAADEAVVPLRRGRRLRLVLALFTQLQRYANISGWWPGAQFGEPSQVLPVQRTFADEGLNGLRADNRLHRPPDHRRAMRVAQRRGLR
jgi:hypothetical protein